MKLFVLLLAFLVVEGKKGGHSSHSHSHGHDDHNHGDCTKDLQKVKGCMDGVFAKASAARNDWRKLKIQEKELCFSSNGCQSPNWESRMRDWKEEKKAKCECVENVFKKDMKDDMQACMKTGGKVTDFEFDDEFWDRKKQAKKIFRGRKGWMKGPGKYKKIFKMCDTMNEVLALCPDDAARANVKECLAAVPFKVKKAMEESMKDDDDDDHDSHSHSHSSSGSNELKEELKQCFKADEDDPQAISKDCEYKMQDIKSEMCRCAVEQLDDTATLQKIHSCYEGEDEDDGEDEGDSDYHLQWIKKKMVKFFCCKKGGKKGSHSSHGSHDSHSGRKHDSHDDDDD